MGISRPIKDRFLEKIKVVESGCHEWQSTLSRIGYGKIWEVDRQSLAHRVSYQLFKGKIPEGKLVCHNCDNRKCVNPDHLYLGTASENVRDKVRRFKGMWGYMKHSYASVQKVRELRDSGINQTQIGRIFGMDQTTVSKILLGKTRLNN